MKDKFDEFYDGNFYTGEDLKKIENQNCELEKKAFEELKKKIIREETEDGKVIIKTFLNEKYLVCEEKNAIYLATKTISTDGKTNIEIEKYKNSSSVIKK